MDKNRIVIIFLVALSALIGFVFFVGHNNNTSTKTDAVVTARPALNVRVTQPTAIDIPMNVTANGSIAAWQEAIIGAEISGLRLKEVNVDVGETVRKGQVLAVFADESVLADIAQSRAALAEAQANLSEAQLNVSKAKLIINSGALSAQQVSQYLTGEKTAAAKVASAKAQLNSQLLRHKYTRVVATDSGVISSRTASLGAVASPGQELFRLIRQHRLEWRGEVTAQEMAQLRIGLKVTVQIPNVADVEGTIRYLAPTLDAQTRNGLVYVDLPEAAQKGIRVGMFGEGKFNLGSSPALTIPQEALSLREGYSYVFRLSDQNGEQTKVSQIKVQLGRRTADRFEILAGIKPDDRLVASGAAFLADGDNVRVIKE